MNDRRPTEAAGESWRKWGASAEDDPHHFGEHVDRRPLMLDEDERPGWRPGLAGLILAALAGAIVATLIGLAIAASRSAQTTSAGDVSRARSAEPSEAPLVDSRAPLTSAALNGQASTGGASPSSFLSPAVVLSPPATPKPTTKPTTKPKPVQRSDGGSIAGGIATWCGPTPTQCQRWGGRALLGAVPSFRWGDKPYRVRVRYRGHRVDVTVVSFCACPGDRIIDLSPYAFRQLAPTWRGTIRVSVQDLR